ncbi:MAG: LPS export ABC transporter permease LptG [Acetobacterales bacterium]
MNITLIISAYFARQFIGGVLTILLPLIGITLLFDTGELLRRAATKAEATFGVVLQMAMLRLPTLIEELVPFAILFGAMLAFWRLNKSNEMIVARAAGVSVWQFLTPPILIAGAIGLFMITVFNPLASALTVRAEQLEDHYLRRQTSFLALSGSGLWLRQVDSGKASFLRAEGVTKEQDTVRLGGVTVFQFAADNSFERRLDASAAYLHEGYWELDQVWVMQPDEPPYRRDALQLDTTLTPSRIQNSFAPPKTLSFWELPAFIRVLEEAGFSAVPHRLHWHSMLASPLIACVMVLLAAAFTVRPQQRKGNMLQSVVGGALTGFLLYTLNRVIAEIGGSAAIPVMLAAWTPACVGLALGLAALLHLEDG